VSHEIQPGLRDQLQQNGGGGQFLLEDISTDEIDRRRATYEPLTESVRELIDATIRSEVDKDAVAKARALVDEATALLQASQIDGAYGIRYTSRGESMPWGNPVIGIRNPIAPPLFVERDETGRYWSDFTLGAAYEGPSAHVHGGVLALLLDHVLGEAASFDDTPSVTGTFEVRYLRTTPLGPLHIEARMERREANKKYVTGHISDAVGVTVEARGVFIIPRWAR
jgi:acyl-coenzyme A thioesterase PaaI-like protein